MSNENCSCCGNDSCPEIVGLRSKLAAVTKERDELLAWKNRSMAGEKP